MTDQPAVDPTHAPGEPAAPAAPNDDERLWATLAHLGGLAFYITGFGHIIAPLLVYLIKKDQSTFIADHARESLNFQITITIAFAICIPLIWVCVGIVLVPLLTIADIVLIIIATLKANKGEAYRYPFCLRLVP